MKRYGALSTFAKVRLVAVWLVLQAVVWWFFSGLGLRFSLAVLTAATLMVLVKTRKPTPR